MIGTMGCVYRCARLLWMSSRQPCSWQILITARASSSDAGKPSNITCPTARSVSTRGKSATLPSSGTKGEAESAAFESSDNSPTGSIPSGPRRVAEIEHMKTGRETGKVARGKQHGADDAQEIGQQVDLPRQPHHRHEPQDQLGIYPEKYSDAQRRYCRVEVGQPSRPGC